MEQIVKTLDQFLNESKKKSEKESEPEKGKKSYDVDFVSWFSGTSICDVEHPKYGKHKVTPTQIKFSPASYKNKMYKCIDKALKDEKISQEDIKKHSKKSSKKLNDGSYDNFMIMHGRDLRDALQELKDALKKVNPRIQDNEKFWERLERVHQSYDPTVGRALESIVSSALGNPSYYFDLDEEVTEFARIALTNLNDNGTEMQMCIYAIQDTANLLNIF